MRTFPYVGRERLRRPQDRPLRRRSSRRFLSADRVQLGRGESGGKARVKRGDDGQALAIDQLAGAFLAGRAGVELAAGLDQLGDGAMVPDRCPQRLDGAAFNAR
ncbi:MAG: hypothetical protein WKF96_24900 [Solirubrobacteraceae bacterium]